MGLLRSLMRNVTSMKEDTSYGVDVYCTKVNTGLNYKSASNNILHKMRPRINQA